MGTVQRQQAFHDRLAGQRVLDLGVDDVDLVQLAGLEIIDGIHRDITGALQGGSRGTVMEILHQTGILAEQGTVAYLTDDIEPVILVGVLPQELEQVLVVSTGHALVGGQHDVGPLGVLQIPLVEEGVLRFVGQVGTTREMVSRIRVK